METVLIFNTNFADVVSRPR